MLTSNIQDKHTVPFSLKGVPAIDHFVQRVSDTHRLEEYFFAQQAPHTRRKIFVVHGLGGMGKTQLCIEFVRQYQQKYSAVFWLDGSSEDALQRSFVDVVTRLPFAEVPPAFVQAAEQAIPDQRLSVQGVLDWLSLPSNRKWLLVVDNVDRDHTAKVKDSLAYDVKQYLPTADHGSVLVTSRLSTLVAPQNSLRLTAVDCDQGRAILGAAGGETILGMMTAYNSRTIELLLTCNHSARQGQGRCTFGPTKRTTSCSDTGRSLHRPNRCQHRSVSGILRHHVERSDGTTRRVSTARVCRTKRLDDLENFLRASQEPKSGSQQSVTALEFSLCWRSLVRAYSFCRGA
jgi:hypothetical protein